MNRIPYLTMCIKEGMRCHNPVPNVARELTKPLVLDGVELLPGTAVNIQIGNCADSYCIKYKVPHHLHVHVVHSIHVLH